MENKSLKKNAIWNFMYSGSNLFFPLITAPYITRVLGASNLGKVDFANSFVQWFTILAAFGVTTYGVRAVSQVRDDKEKLSIIFFELFFINLLFSIFSTIIFYFIIFQNSFFQEQKSLFIVISFSLILNAVNIDWFYQGIEEYSYITVRNFIIKIFSIISIFMFIRDPSDYIIYGLISVLSVSLSGVLNVINVRKYVVFSFQTFSLTKHLNSLFTFFLIIAVINIYTNLDKTLLGFLDNTISVAFLARAKMIVGVGGTISNSIAAVAMPRASYYLKHNLDKYKELVNKIPTYMLFLTIPMTTGIIILSPEIMFILGGKEFSKASGLLSVIAIVIIFSTISTFIQQQVLVPSGNERMGLIASILTSIISLLLNLMLIPVYGYTGAGISLVIAEFSAAVIRYLFIRKINVDYIIFFNISTVRFITASLLMLIPIILLKKLSISVFLSFSLSAFFGSITYFLILLIMKEEIVIEAFSSFYNKIIKNQ